MLERRTQFFGVNSETRFPIGLFLSARTRQLTSQALREDKGPFWYYSSFGFWNRNLLSEELHKQSIIIFCSTLCKQIFCIC